VPRSIAGLYKNMKIVICGSMSSVKKMVDIGKKLRILDHKVILPKFTEQYALMENLDKIHSESVKNKIEHDLIRDYFEEIKNADAVLIINIDKNGIKNYIGGNAFLEMGFAHVLNKKVFLLNSIPEIMYKDEIEAMRPVVLNSDLSLIH